MAQPTVKPSTRRTRKKLQRLLGKSARYVNLPENSKAATVNFTQARHQHETIPDKGNFGVLPKRNLFILDLDIKGDITPESMLKVFKDDLGLDFSDTLMVRTPSGGLHVYFRWYRQVLMPGNIKLSKVCEDLAGDIRSPRANGYALGAGSSIDGSEYTIVNDARPKKFTFSELSRFLTMVYNDSIRTIEQLDHFLKTDETPREVQAREKAEQKEARKQAALSELVDRVSIKNTDLDNRWLRLTRRRVARMRNKPYHVKRAAIYNMLACCVDHDTITEYWRELGIDRNSSRIEIPLADRDCTRELARLTPPKNHARYCKHAGVEVCKLSAPKVTPSATSGTDNSVDSSKPSDRGRLKFRGWISVVRFDRVNDALRSRQHSDARVLASRIVHDFVQPWSNLGKTEIVLATMFLADHYDVDPSEIANAKKLLLRRGILSIERRQYIGKSTVFTVSEAFKDFELGSACHRLATAHATPILVSAESRSVVSALTGEVLDGFEHWSDLPGFARRAVESSSSNVIDLLRDSSYFSERYLHFPKKSLAR